MKPGRTWAVIFVCTFLGVHPRGSGADADQSVSSPPEAPVPEVPVLPAISKAAKSSPTSHAFSASAYQRKPLDLARLGFVEEEYFVTGQARVFDWSGRDAKAVARGPYTTRILVRRPRDGRRFSGTAIVEPMNPSEDVDLPIMWAESYEQFIAAGDAWVGITIKPNTIRALKEFDPDRYASLAMPNPRGQPACNPAQINAFSMPTTPEDETGLAWDILSQVGALLKSATPQNPLGQAAARLYMTGQSQTAGYARLYVSVFARRVVASDRKPLYDGYLYSGSPPWQVPINQCRADLAAGDSRLITAAAGVPVIELFTQGDMQTNVPTRRPDSDEAIDRFRRYEVAGAPHVDPWEMLSFARPEDMRRAHGRTEDNADSLCSPKSTVPSDFPVRYIFNAAWRSLDDWVRRGIPAPHGSPLKIASSQQPLPPEQLFLVDAYGNALGGVRTPYVDVPTARWIGAKSGPFICLFHGYKIPMERSVLRSIYRNHDEYVAKVRVSAEGLVRQRWLTSVDATAIVAEAKRANVP